MKVSAKCRKRVQVLVTTLILYCFAFAAQTSDNSSAAPDRTLLVIGDSLSAAYGIAPEQGWVSLLARRLARSHPNWQVVNASISGETTAGGAARISTTLARHAPDLVAIELGANDALRGLPLDQATQNLSRMIEAAQQQDAQVLLIGIRIPTNYGPDYANALREMYLTLAQKHGVTLLPFLLEPIAAERDAFQADNLHPTAASQPKVLEHVWQVLEPMLARMGQPGPSF